MRNCEYHITHLGFIEGIISRMNDNSRNVKTWTVAIISALTALYAKNSSIILIVVGMIVVILFGCLDTYYLCLERRYRGLYKHVEGMINEKQDCEEDVDYFDMDLKPFQTDGYSYFSAMKSFSIFPFYLILLIFFIALLYLSTCPICIGGVQ